MRWTRSRGDPRAVGRPRQPLRLRLRLRLPGLTPDAEIGLGDLVGRATSAAGIRPCTGCLRRAAALNRLVVLSAAGRRRFSARSRPAGSAAAAGCWSYAGRCTGWRWWVTECVEGPASQDPDAEIIQQCCGGFFGRYSYPWIEVCPGQAATTGCGWCLW
jgi:hypothetical protein